MLATGFVDVGLPFWYSLQWRVTVPAAVLHDETSRTEPDNTVNATVDPYQSSHVCVANTPHWTDSPV